MLISYKNTAELSMSKCGHMKNVTVNIVITI